jgi:hypothetical protein
MNETTQKLCFVIGPIGDAGTEARTHADWLLNGIIRPVFQVHFPDYLVQRADEIKAPGDINSQIINRLMSAALVIADMSMHNANAFYELAVRHMVSCQRSTSFTRTGRSRLMWRRTVRFTSRERNLATSSVRDLNYKASYRT